MGFLSDFFQFTAFPADQMPYHWNFYLIGLSYFVAVIASFVALDMAGRLRQATKNWFGLCIMGALAIGCGIFSMHFIGMLAYVMAMPMSYDFFITTLSLIIAVVASGFALLVIKKEEISVGRLLVGAIILGLAIASMHYTGMAAMVGVKIRYLPGLFFISIGIAIGASLAALLLMLFCDKLFGMTKLLVKIGSSLVMGVAIAGMHYVGMYAAIITPLKREAVLVAETGFGSMTLALMITVLAAVIIALTLVSIGYRHRIITKLFMGYVILAVLGISIGVMIIVHIRSSIQQLESVGWNKNKIAYLQKFDHFLKDIKSSSELLPKANAAEREQILTQIKFYHKELDKKTNQLLDLSLSPSDFQAKILYYQESIQNELIITIEYLEKKLDEKVLSQQFEELTLAVNRGIVFVEKSIQTEFYVIGELGPPVIASLHKINYMIIVLVVSSGIFSVFIIFFLEHQISTPIKKLKDVATLVGKGDLSYVVDIKSEDELGMLATEFNSMVHSLDHLNTQLKSISELGEALSICSSEQEVREVVTLFTKQVIPGRSGAIALCDNEGNFLEKTIAWGEGKEKLFDQFQVHACWAIRKGQIFFCDHFDDVRCKHMDPSVGMYVCIPMNASGKLFGVCTIFAGQIPFTEQERKLMPKLAWDISSALVNVRLREHFQQLSVLDSLTSLYNRRYMQEFLEREVNRAERNQFSLSVFMIDLDHFKEINDLYGHVIGDEVLQELANHLRNNFRKVDIICRYGGDEFVVIMTETSAEHAVKLAETLCRGVHNITTRVGHQLLNFVKISVGVAIYPEHGQSGKELIAAADKALYQAKKMGRDRVCRATRDDLS